MVRFAWVLIGLGMVLPIVATAQGFEDFATFTNSTPSINGHLCGAYGNATIGCAASSPYVTSGGLVGIGTESPVYPLDVSGTVRATRFVGDGSGLTGVVASTGDRIVSNTTSMVADGATGLISVTQSGTNTAYFHPSLGLVTVGVSSTGEIKGVSLKAYSNVSNSVLGFFRNEADKVDLTIDTSGTAGVRMMGGAVDNFVLGTNGTEAIKMIGPITGGNHIIFNASGTEAMRIVSNGWVGIGTNNPSASLHVTGGIKSQYLNILSSSPTSNIWFSSVGIEKMNWGGGLFFRTTSSSGVLNTNQMFLSGNGNVGVGMATPTVPLEVSGSIKASGVVQVSGTEDEGCGSPADEGKIRVNPVTHRFQICRHYN